MKISIITEIDMKKELKKVVQAGKEIDWNVIAPPRSARLSGAQMPKPDFIISNQE